MSERLTAQDRREQIMLCARDVFARLGYDATHTAEIAQRAGVSERLLYKHFSGKRELFLAVAAEVARRVAEQYRQLAAANLSVHDGIHQLYAWRFAPQAPGAEQPLFFGRTYGPFDDPAMDAAMGHAYRVMAGGATAYFASLAGRGLLRPGVDPKAAAWLLAAIIREHESMRLAYPRPELAELERHIVRQFVDLIAAPGDQDAPPPRHDPRPPAQAEGSTS
jgi:AcrR family transcriptional regulator